MSELGHIIQLYVATHINIELKLNEVGLELHSIYSMESTVYSNNHFGHFPSTSQSVYEMANGTPQYFFFFGNLWWASFRRVLEICLYIYRPDRGIAIRRYHLNHRLAVLCTEKDENSESCVLINTGTLLARKTHLSECLLKFVLINRRKKKTFFCFRAKYPGIWNTKT